MAVDIHGSFSLLLLLGLWEPVCLLSSTQPKGLTKARWFEIQHIQTSPQQCNSAMLGVNNYTQHCKPKNTFLHESFRNVAAACGSPNITCKNGQKNCHKSAGPVNMTDCALTGGTYPSCRYSSAVKYKFFIVACERPLPAGPCALRWHYLRLRTPFFCLTRVLLPFFPLFLSFLRKRKALGELDSLSCQSRVKTKRNRVAWVTMELRS